MRNDSKTWMEGAAERSIRSFLMTAETLTKDNEALDADDVETLHWCWEGVHHIAAARLAQAQLEAHQAAHAPTSLDDVMRKVEEMEAKLTGNGGNGSSVLSKP